MQAEVILHVGCSSVFPEASSMGLHVSRHAQSTCEMKERE